MAERMTAHDAFILLAEVAADASPERARALLTLANEVERLHRIAVAAWALTEEIAIANPTGRKSPAEFELTELLGGGA